MMTEMTQRQSDRESRGAQMRRRILKAALKLFTRMSYDDVTIRKIASAIGYSPGNLYYYFASKDAVFAELRDEGFLKLREAQNSARTSPDPRTRLHAHARAYVTFALSHREYYELMFLLGAPMKPPSKEDPASAATESFDLLKEDVQLAIDAGALPPTPSSSRIALLLLSVLHGLVALVLRQRVSAPSIKSESEMVSQTVDLLFEYTGIVPSSNAVESETPGTE